MLHNGLKKTLYQIPTKFWRPKSRNQVKRIINVYFASDTEVKH